MNVKADCSTIFEENTLLVESNDVINKVKNNFENHKKDHLGNLMQQVQPLVERITDLNKEIMILQKNPTSGKKIMTKL